MAKSADAPACAVPLATVHPVPTPLSTVLLVRRRVNNGGSSEKFMLFIRGNAISGAPNINGTSQLPIFFLPLFIPFTCVIQWGPRWHSG